MGLRVFVLGCITEPGTACKRLNGGASPVEGMELATATTQDVYLCVVYGTNSAVETACTTFKHLYFAGRVYPNDRIGLVPKLVK